MTTSNCPDLQPIRKNKDGVATCIFNSIMNGQLANRIKMYLVFLARPKSRILVTYNPLDCLQAKGTHFNNDFTFNDKLPLLWPIPLMSMILQPFIYTSIEYVHLNTRF